MPLFYAGQLDYLDKLNLVGAKNVKNTYTCSVSSTKSIDLSAGYAVVLNVTGGSAVATTIDFINPPVGGTPIEVVIFVTVTNAAAHTLIWPAGVHFIGAAPAISTTANKTDIFVLRSYDSGTTFYATASIGYTT